MFMMKVQKKQPMRYLQSRTEPKGSVTESVGSVTESAGSGTELAESGFEFNKEYDSGHPQLPRY